MAAAMAFPGQQQDWEGSPCPVAHSVAHSVRSPVEALMGMSWAVAVAVLRNQRKEQESWARWMAHSLRSRPRRALAVATAVPVAVPLFAAHLRVTGL